MASYVYECLFILDSNRYARDPNAVAATIPVMVEKFGGEVLANRLWNEQRLAYPIKGHRKGTYWLTYFRLESDKVTDFNRACRLNDNVLRNLVLRVEPRLVDVLVSHALGKAASASDSSSQTAAKDSPSKPKEDETTPSKDDQASETDSGEPKPQPPA